MCANAGGTLEAFAFILEQDLSGVSMEREFAVDAEWAHHMIEIAELQKLLQGVKFDAAIVQADQFATQGGQELARETKIVPVA